MLKRKNSRFPMSRIKTVIQQNEEIGKTTATVPVVLSKALEMFIEEMVSTLVKEADKDNTKRVKMEHYNKMTGNYTFLE